MKPHSSQATSTGSTLDQVALHAIQLFDCLLNPQTEPREMEPWLAELGELFESMALGVFEFDLAGVRLRNAQRFLQAGELGAARFEIRHLRGGLKEHLQTSTTVRRASISPRPTERWTASSLAAS